MSNLYVLFEHAAGYAVFLVKEFEEVGMFLPQVEASVTDLSRFNSVVKLIGFSPFKTAIAALENINAVSEGILTEDLQHFIDITIPKGGKKSKPTIGVSDPKLGAAISESLGLTCTHIGVVPEIIRGWTNFDVSIEEFGNYKKYINMNSIQEPTTNYHKLMWRKVLFPTWDMMTTIPFSTLICGIRYHFHKLVKGFNSKSSAVAQLGLGHSYSRAKVKFNVHRVDNMIIQSIALLDQLDKDVNTFSMRIREWYSYHFPELVKIVPENYTYARLVSFIKNRKELSEESLENLEEIVMDSAKAQAILDASRSSMGMDISIVDLMNIEMFAKRVINLADYRKELAEYLKTKMSDVAPNLATLIGEQVGARLIAHAGSLTNLAKYPASTVQILGAEKALFRALKTRGNTPKYGLLFNSTFIGRAGMKNKGRISRYLANKCSIASRIDCFTDIQTNVFGEKLRQQVEDRLKFYETGDIPKKNIEVMKEALEEMEKVQAAKAEKKKKKKKKRKVENGETVDQNGIIEDDVTEEPPKKKKKKKKHLEEKTED